MFEFEIIFVSFLCISICVRLLHLRVVIVKLIWMKLWK